jgi:hypothetical protein
MLSFVPNSLSNRKPEDVQRHASEFKQARVVHVCDASSHGVALVDGIAVGSLERR